MSYIPRVACYILLAFCMTGMSIDAWAEAPQPEIPDAWPDWLKKKMVEEARKKRAKSHKLDNITLSVPGKLEGEPTKGESFWVILADVGAETSVLCSILVDSGVPGRQALLMNQKFVAETVSQHDGGELKQQSPYFMDSDFIGQVPFVAMEWIYLWTDKNEQIYLRLSKVRAAKIGATTVTCIHDEAGYRKTFARFFEHLIAKSEWPQPDPEIVYTEGYTMSIGGRPAGYQITDYRVGAEGAVRIDTSAVNMIQTDPNTVVIGDSYRLEFSESDGSLVEAYVRTFENGQQQVSAHLKQEEGWQVAGDFRGKAIDLVVEAAPTQLSMLGMLQLTQKMIADDTLDEASASMWMPEIDPSTFTFAGIRVDERGKDITKMTTTVGPLQISGDADKDGVPTQATISVGGFEMRLDRAFRDGTLP